MTVVSAFAFWIGFENGGILEAFTEMIGNTSGTKVINIIVPTNCDTLRIQAGIYWEGTIDNVSVQSIGIGAGGDSNLVFSVSDAVTNNNEAMRIKPDGKVGIGTTTPASELEVSGTLTSKAVDINASSITTGTALDISDGDALTTGTLANIVSNSSDSGTRTLFHVTNDNPSATGTIPFRVTQDADVGAGGQYSRGHAFEILKEGNIRVRLTNEGVVSLSSNNNFRQELKPVGNTSLEVHNYGNYVATFGAVDHPKGLQLASDSDLLWSNSTTGGQLQANESNRRQHGSGCITCRQHHSNGRIQGFRHRICNQRDV
jgi:hypothetical protein